MLGKEIKAGDIFPQFTAVNNSLEPVSLKDTKGVRIFLTVPSVDTPVCDLEVRTFNEEASKIDRVTIYTVSMDLPFALARWCGAEGIEKVVTLSDYKDRDFSMYIIGWAISGAMLLFGLYLALIDKTQEKLAEHQFAVSKALRDAKRRDDKQHQVAILFRFAGSKASEHRIRSTGGNALAR